MAIKTVKGKPITGSGKVFKPEPPVLTDQARTSAGAQRILRQPAQKWGNPYNETNVPAPANRNFERDQIAALPSNRGTSPSKQGGQAKSDYSVTQGTSLSDDMMAAVGYAPNATKSTNPIISGYPTRGSKRR